MKTKPVSVIVSVLFIMSFISIACGAQAIAEPTSTPQPTATKTLVPTATFTATATPRPTRTPNLAATQRAEELNAEAQKYVDLGYLSSAEGKFEEYDDFSLEWAQMNWYDFEILGQSEGEFFISAHAKWSSAYRNANVSGCGYVFGLQANGDHFAVFLDRSKILFLNADYSTSNYSYPVGLTRGKGSVKFENPADNPVEADFTLIVKGSYAYILVDGEVIGEYTLPQNRLTGGIVALSLLSGTNKDFGTRCEMTNVHAFFSEN